MERARSIIGGAPTTKVLDAALKAFIALHANRSEFIDGVSGKMAKEVIGSKTEKTFPFLYERWQSGV